MQGSHCLEVALGLPDEQHADGHEEERVDRDEDDEHPVPGHARPEVLQRNGQVGPEQHAPVGAPCRNDGQVLLERQIGLRLLRAIGNREGQNPRCPLWCNDRLGRQIEH